VIWHGQKSWNALLSSLEGLIRGRSGGHFLGILRTCTAGTSRHDRGVVVGCLYLPNGNPAPGPKFDYSFAGSNV